MPEISPAKPLFTAQTMGGLMWTLFVVLVINILFVLGHPFWAMAGEIATLREGGLAFTRALMGALPVILLAGAVYDLATFFYRNEKGERFTARNVKTLKTAGETLFWSALVSALIAPSVIAWIDGRSYGLVWQTTDLTLGVAAMGIGLFGVANILADAVVLQTEHDEIV